MEVLRVPPYPITTTWDVPDANHAYLIYVEDVVDHSIDTAEVTSTSASKVEYVLPRTKIQYDRDFVFRVYDTDLTGEIVVDSNLTVYRPYVDPNNIGTTPTEVEEYKHWEIIARSIMDAYLQNDSANGEGFYNHKLIVQGIGEGTDYFPIWHNPKRILRVYENNMLVYNGEDVALTVIDSASSNPGGLTRIETSAAHNFAIGDMVTFSGFTPDIYNGTYPVTSVDSSTEFQIKLNTYSNPATDMGRVQRLWETTFAIAANNSAIIKVITGDFNRFESTPTRLPLAAGDLNYYGRSGTSFPKGNDYTFVLDVGYKAVPPDVEKAARMLIEDLKCGNNEYWKRFVTQYNTDQFSIKYAPEFLKGTGNLIVDKILDGYKGNVIKPGVI